MARRPQKPPSWKLEVPPHIETDWLLIVDVLCDHYGISIDLVLGSTRRQHAVNVRHLAMFLVRKHTGLSFPAIGERFERDHRTVQNAYRRIDQILESSATARANLEVIEKQIQHRKKQQDATTKRAADENIVQFPGGE